jgi:hypothetical protein
MNYTKIGALPTHRYIWVDSYYTHEEPVGLVEAMWVGLTAIPGRAWGINVILRDGGALYRNIPPHAVAFSEDTVEDDWTLADAQLWDCYSYNFAVLQNSILREMEVCVRISGMLLNGKYLFSTAHLHDGWSDAPEQDKEFIFVQLNCGRLTIQPTNRVRFIDQSYITDTLPKLKLQTEIHSCEKTTTTVC